MKKAISLLLALVMCLSLCACGGGSDIETSPTEATADATESQTESTEATVSNELAQWLPYMCGEWQTLYRDDVGKIEPVILSEDGTVRIGTRTLGWNCEYISASDIELQFCDGEEIMYGFSCMIQENGELTALIRIDSSEIVLYKPSCYETVSITPENFGEYFELRYEMEEVVNGFGEVEAVRVFVKWALKDTYFSRISKELMDDTWDHNVIDSGAAEYSFEMGALTADIDLEEKTFAVTEFVAREPETYVGEPVFTDYYGFNLTAEIVTSDYLEAGVYSSPNSRHGFELARIELTLYLVKEEQIQ